MALHWSDPGGSGKWLLWPTCQWPSASEARAAARRPASLNSSSPLPLTRKSASGSSCCCSFAGIAHGARVWTWFGGAKWADKAAAWRGAVGRKGRRCWEASGWWKFPTLHALGDIECTQNFGFETSYLQFQEGVLECTQFFLQIEDDIGCLLKWIFLTINL